jgi:TRAP-type C4-dicarboxylate transport system permease small subunit
MFKSLLHRLDQWFILAVDVFAVAAGILIFLCMLGTSVDVLSRYLFNRPIEVMVALTEFALLYITFLSAPWLLRINGHIQMDFFVSRMKPKTRARWDILNCLLGMFTCVVLIGYGAAVTRELWVMKVHDVFKIAGFPKAIIVAIIPLGNLLLLFQFLKNLLQARAVLKRI